jgi:hypothetical protein
MDSERAAWRADLSDSARKLAGSFELRRLEPSRGGDLISENIADLTAAGIIPSGGPDDVTLSLAEAIELTRIIAGGCGSTAFAMSAPLVAQQPPDARLRLGHLLDAAVFLGLAQRAFELAVQYIADRPDPTAENMALLPGTQFAVARMRGSVATMTALLIRSATEQPGLAGGMVADDRASYLPRYYLSTVAEQVVSAAFGIIGAPGSECGQRITLIWADLKVGPVLPFSGEAALEAIGKAAFGIGADDTPRWL